MEGPLEGRRRELRQPVRHGLLDSVRDPETPLPGGENGTIVGRGGLTLGTGSEAREGVEVRNTEDARGSDDAEMLEVGRAEDGNVTDDEPDYVSLGGSDHASAKSMDGEGNSVVRPATVMDYDV